MPAPPRNYVKAERHDDFLIVECPDDAEYLCPFLPLGSKFGAKGFARMAIDGALPQGAVVQQYENVYLFYDGLLWLLDADKQLVNPDDPIPALEPYIPAGRDEAKWRRFDNCD